MVPNAVAERGILLRDVQRNSPPTLSKYAIDTFIPSKMPNVAWPICRLSSRIQTTLRLGVISIEPLPAATRPFVIQLGPMGTFPARGNRLAYVPYKIAAATSQRERRGGR
jgi:hypothetical protein